MTVDDKHHFFSLKKGESKALSRSDLMQRHERVVDDLYIGLKLHHLWRALAWEDVIQRYRRSVLGIAWIMLSFWSMIAIFVILFGRSSPTLTQFEYTIYLATGLAAWNFLSVGITKSTAAFASNAGWIRSTPAPFSVLAYRAVLAGCYEFAIVFLSILPLVFFYSFPSALGLLVLVAAAILFVINLVFLSLLLGSIGAWSSDFQQIVPNVMRIAFFATPIFWEFSSMSGARRLMADYNPFTHFVQLMRAPLMGQMPSAVNWGVALVCSLVVIVASIFVFRYARVRLAAWV